MFSDKHIPFVPSRRPHPAWSLSYLQISWFLTMAWQWHRGSPWISVDATYDDDNFNLRWDQGGTFEFIKTKLGEQICIAYHIAYLCLFYVLEFQYYCLKKQKTQKHILSGWWFQPTPLKHHGVFVSWDDYSIPNWMESHKIPWFQTTNQL